jgi:hypothetical protein
MVVTQFTIQAVMLRILRKLSNNFSFYLHVSSQFI